MAEDSSRKKLSTKGRINRRREVPGEPKSWWTTSRRKFVVGGAITTGIMLAGGGVWLASRDDSKEIEQDALELQRGSGWNVGSEEKKLILPDVQGTDSQGGADWKKYLDQSAMLSAYQPLSSQWVPFFVPTLIQSLQFESLRGQLAPILTADMREAYERGRALAKDLLANAENAGETALIADLPGRDAVAFGAGLSDTVRLVTLFDNFPHPLGVTPSQETLAAMLYYAAEVQAKQQAAPPNAPPLFLLDSKRLEPYADAEAQFDNRYVAKLPSAQKFQELGIKSLIYVTPDRTRTAELDDLNEDFVEYKDRGLQVAVLPLSDFAVGGGSDQARSGGGGSWDDTSRGNYHYGGGSVAPFWFFYSYPFYRPSASYIRSNPSFANARAASVPPIAAPRYVPAPRPTMFTGTRIGRPGVAGVGRSKPSGFGRTTVRVAPSGSVVGTRAGRSGYYSPSRSGSFGRGGWSSG